MNKVKRNGVLKVERAKELKGKDKNLFSNSELFDHGDGCTSYGFLAEIMRHPEGEVAGLLGVAKKVSSIKKM